MLAKNNRTFIICEMSQTYEGSFEIASKLVQAAIIAQADAIKFQVFVAAELATEDYKHFKLFNKLEFKKEQWGRLIDQAHVGGILALADVFGIQSAQMLADLNIDGFKIHSTDIKNFPLLQFLAKTGKPLILSTGGSYDQEIGKAIVFLKDKGVDEIVLMHGFQSYPTLVEHTNLNKLIYLQKKYGLPVGFADHIDGDHILHYDLCSVAMGLGACVLEKHITLDRSLKMEDYESALNPLDFRDFVARVRLLDSAFGVKTGELSDPEKVYRQNTKKHIVAAVELHRGQIIKEEDIAMKRTAEEYDFLDREMIIGKKVGEDIKPNQVIRLENIV